MSLVGMSVGGGIATAGIVGGAAALGGSLLNTFGAGGGGGGSIPAAPAFQTDPIAGQSETGLFNFGSDVLKGILPSSYQDLITPNSPQFQTMLNSTNAAIQGAGESTAAAQGTARGGAAQEAITKAIASNTANLSYSDLLNTQLNQKAILGSGLDALNIGGNMALTNQGQMNSYASNIYNAQLGYGSNMSNIASQNARYASQSIGSGLSSASGGIGSILAMMQPTAAPGVGGGGGSGGVGILGALGTQGNAINQLMPTNTGTGIGYWDSNGNFVPGS